jgi:hypothetical protein
MDLFDFNALPLQYQAQYAWDNGTFLSSRRTREHVINLYHTKKFFVEVHFSLRNEGVDRISSFTKLDNLDPFLEQIELDIP